MMHSLNFTKRSDGVIPKKHSDPTIENSNMENNLQNGNKGKQQWKLLRV